jgi:hypothetical protein
VNTAIRSIVVALACAAWMAGAAPERSPVLGRIPGQEVKFDVNDVSYLWPVATSQADVDALISSDDTLADGVSRIWPQRAFDTVIKTAETVSVETSAGTAATIAFSGTELRNPHAWKVVAFRVDPCAPGCDPKLTATFGAVPQLRLVLQPITVDAGTVQVHDITAHLVFGFISGTDSGRFVPDKAAFREIVSDLKALKADSEAAGAATVGPLRVHPGLQARAPRFADKVKAFITRRALERRLMAVAFMGLAPRPEPWVFYAMARQADGTFARTNHPAFSGDGGQMLTLRGGTPVMPAPSNTNLPSGKGVSTSVLFPDDAGRSRLDKPVFAGEARPLHRDIPDIIANPALAHFRNTDCVSCHSESARRSTLKIAAGDATLRYTPPAGISGVDPGHLPQNVWNVRNFGWFKQAATATQRTANEAAESADVINREYLTAPKPTGGVNEPQPRRSEVSMSEPVASPLTLVMTIKSPQDYVELKGLLAKLQGLPPDKNPITVALTKLATVHFARFVFLNDKQLAVITTYDGSFDDYIDAFVDAIGGIFDQLLAHMADAPPLPVAANRQKFLDYVKKNDLTCLPPFYSAYPKLKVMDILTLQKQHGGS